jgi:hypothetical protein
MNRKSMGLLAVLLLFVLAVLSILIPDAPSKQYISRSRNKRSPKTGVRATPAPLFSGTLQFDFREVLI